MFDSKGKDGEGVPAGTGQDQQWERRFPPLPPCSHRIQFYSNSCHVLESRFQSDTAGGYWSTFCFHLTHCPHGATCTSNFPSSIWYKMFFFHCFCLTHSFLKVLPLRISQELECSWKRFGSFQRTFPRANNYLLI